MENCELHSDNNKLAGDMSYIEEYSISVLESCECGTSTQIFIQKLTKSHNHENGGKSLVTRERIPRTCTGVDIWRNMWGQACGFDKITSQFIIVLEQKTIVLQNIGGGGHPDLRMLKT